MTIKDIIKDGMLVIIRSYHNDEEFDDIFMGEFKYVNGEVISLDDNTYSLDQRIVRYETDFTQNVSVVYVETEVLSKEEWEHYMGRYFGSWLNG